VVRKDSNSGFLVLTLGIVGTLLVIRLLAAQRRIIIPPDEPIMLKGPLPQ
jgi:hypothetical protein